MTSRRFSGARAGRAVAKWAVLTTLAVVAGAALGSSYALLQQPAEEPLTAGELRRGDIWPPTAPVLTAPADGALTPTLTPEFTWERSVDNLPRIIYVLEFSRDAKFRDDLVRITVSNIEDTRWQPPSDEPFPPGVTLYWRAYAIDEGLNQSPFSETWSFTPLPVPVAPPLLDGVH